MKYLLIILIMFSFSACSIFQTTDKKEEVVDEKEEVDEVYVFDDVSENVDKAEEIKELEEEIDNTLGETDNQNLEDTGVFNDTKVSQKAELPTEGNSYFLQLGAFSSLKRAEQFVGEIDSLVPFSLSIIYNSQTSLYTVRSSAYTNRPDVEKVRADFWSKNLFKDAFIITE
jgi:hypothetical protein